MSIIDNREVIDIVVEVNYQEKGDTGKSAYQYALDQGFVGTEVEWIQSLKQPALDAAETANEAAQNANEKAQLADQSAQDANQATANANTATANANQATQLAEDATISANEAANFANSQRGWTIQEVEEDYLGKKLRKIAGYIGGTGVAPTQNVGLYFKSDGTFTADKNEASNYKGDKPSFTIGINGHWVVDGEDSGWVASTGTDNMDAVYGVQYNVTHATPVLERIGENMFNHISLPVQSKMRRCVVNLDRTVNYWLHKDDSTLKEDGSPANLTGADGQFQLYLPDRYMRFSQGGDIRRAEMSLYPFVGAKFYPAEFISVSHATVQRSTNKMMSVVNDDPDFAGGGTGVNIYNSVAITALSRAVARTYARNLGAGWELEDYTTDLSIQWGYIIEYANFNSQLPFTEELTPEGYKQGGLGNGVTNTSSAGWSGFNGSYPFVPIGYTASLGNNTGVKELIIPDFGGSEFITEVPSYRGIENPFGHIFTILDGIQCFYEQGQSFNTYVTDDPALFNDENHNGFRFVGIQPMNASGYITEMHFGEFGDTVTKANVGGSATTYMCDYQYLPTATNEYKWYAKGGHASFGATAGLGCVHSNFRVSNAYAYSGFRLCAKQKRSA